MTVALPIIGAIGGGIIFGGAQAVLAGMALGSAVGRLFAEDQDATINLPTQTGTQLGDLRVQSSCYGQTIPKLYGQMRLGGNIIWATDIKEVETVNTYSQTVESGGKGGGGSSTTTTQETITYTYFASLAIAVCEGAVDEINRIWADSVLLDSEILNSCKFNIHLGTEDQLPDDIIGKHKAPGSYPAYRGLCYIVVEDFPLAQFGNRIPQFTFEVRRSVRQKPAVEEKIKEVVLIPGAGEFVYGTNIYNKQPFTCEGRVYPVGEKKPFNMHNYHGIANVSVSLDQMQKTLPNLEWVALVVTWFATSLDAGGCRIVPKVEFKPGDDIVTPNDWHVGGIGRARAEEVLRYRSPEMLEFLKKHAAEMKGAIFNDIYTDSTIPTYGGTPSDDTVRQLCQEMKNRGLKIMLYPMIFVDELHPNPKPWRGRIKANSGEDIHRWFNKGDGYNRFIHHYAYLTRGFADAFIIGSELIGLTSFTDAPGKYPAVDELVNLAHQVKNIVGNHTLVTYAADWSEYHHTNGGWFNLDPLWSCEPIDFVGIDAYFPLTEDLPANAITEEKIKAGWHSGEGYDYYYNWERTTKHYFAQESPHAPYKYAWKNIAWWWENYHHNPDGNVTGWQPKMKPIWFTEFGFPSVDAASNQPNVFYDPSSSESFFPRGSKGKVNFYSQRQALNASLDYWIDSNSQLGMEGLIAKRFIWTWDARPFPFWPDFKNIWRDGNLWATGHWINGKLGFSSLGAIVAEILESSGLKPDEYDITRLTESVEGYIINSQTTAREVLEQLQTAYFFDAVQTDGILKFMPRVDSLATVNIHSNELVPNQANNQSIAGNNEVTDILSININQEMELPAKIILSYIDRSRQYDVATMHSSRQIVNSKEQFSFNLPLLLNDTSAKEITDITLYRTWQERIHYSLTMPPKYAYLEPTDIINVYKDNINYQMRIVNSEMTRGGQIKISAISCNTDIYNSTVYFQNQQISNYNYELPKIAADIITEFIDAPPLPIGNNQNAVMYIAASSCSDFEGVAIYRSLDNGADYHLLTNIGNAATMGFTVNQLAAGPSYVFDTGNEIIVQLLHGSLNSVSELSFLNGANAAIIGDELIQFKYAELIGDKRYRLRVLLRGRQGTEDKIDTHKIGDRFIFINSALKAVDINSNLIGALVTYKPVQSRSSIGEAEEKSFTYNARCLKPFAPVHVKVHRAPNNDIIINWCRRARADNGWRSFVEVPLGEDAERYEVDILCNNQLIRTLSTNTPVANYSYSNQLIDFNNVIPSGVSASIYQISGQIGRGYPAHIILD